jgi:hypothetical protein
VIDPLLVTTEVNRSSCVNGCVSSQSYVEPEGFAPSTVLLPVSEFCLIVTYW